MPAGFDVRFADRTAALSYFEEGGGPLTTDNSHACMESTSKQRSPL